MACPWRSGYNLQQFVFTFQLVSLRTGTQDVSLVARAFTHRAIPPALFYSWERRDLLYLVSFQELPEAILRCLTTVLMAFLKDGLSVSFTSPIYCNPHIYKHCLLKYSVVFLPFYISCLCFVCCY